MNNLIRRLRNEPWVANYLLNRRIFQVPFSLGRFGITSKARCLFWCFFWRFIQRGMWVIWQTLEHSVYTGDIHCWETEGTCEFLNSRHGTLWGLVNHSMWIPLVVFRCISTLLNPNGTKKLMLQKNPIPTQPTQPTGLDGAKSCYSFNQRPTVKINNPKPWQQPTGPVPLAFGVPRV